ncbi:unnamed protein product [Arctogadus glacialis]
MSQMFNTTPADICCAFESPILDKLLPPILILEFIFGLLGNIVAMWMFVFHMDSWKPNSVYLVHLAVADTIVLFCLPFRADYYRRGKDWLYGDIPCRILLFLLAANRAAGIFFLTAVAVDRYLKIVHPLHPINRMGLGYALWVSFSLWGLIVLATGYLLSDSHFFYRNNRTQCESFNICMGYSPLSTWHNTFYVVQFFLPTAIVAFCTISILWQLRTKTIDSSGKIKRAVQFVLAVALIFVTCFFPSTISRVAVWILKNWYSECVHFREANLAFYTSVCFTYFNSVLNPLVYYFSSPSFSGIFQKLLNKLLGRKEEEEQVSTVAAVSKCINVTTAAMLNPIITVRVATNALLEGVTTPVTLRGITAQPPRATSRLKSALPQPLCPPLLVPLVLLLDLQTLLLSPLPLLMDPMVLPLIPRPLRLCPPVLLSDPPTCSPRPAVSCLVAARVKLKVLHCPECDLRLYAKNLKTHLVRRHTAPGVDVASSNQLASQCDAGRNGVETTLLNT